MVNIVDTLNDTLRHLKNANSSTKLSKNNFDLLSRELSSTVSTIGLELGKVESGLKTLTQEQDDVLNDVPVSKLKQIVNKTGIAEVTSKTPGFKLQTPAVIIGSAAPEALAAAMKETGARKKDIKTALNTVQPVNFGELDKVIDAAFAPQLAFSSIKGEIFKNVSKELQSVLNKIDNGLGAVLSDVLELKLQTLNTAVVQLAIKDGLVQQIPESVKKEIFSAISQKNFTRAAKLLQGYSDSTQVELIRSLSKLETSLNAASSNAAIKVAEIQSRSAGSTQGRNVRPTDIGDSEFPFVMSEEELTVELKDISREITECIVSWTETAKDQNLTAKDFNTMLSQNGKTIPYHYLILRNGNLQRSRPIKEVGGKLNNGHERYSIQIAFVGGIDANSDVKDYTQYLSSRSLTIPQRKTLYTFLRILYSAYPGVQVLGHNSIDIKNKAPGFSVENYISDVFGKTNIIEDPSGEGPLTRQQLINKSAE